MPTPDLIRCPNCQTEVKGEYCFQCGQRQTNIDRHLITLLREAFEDIFAFDSKTARTLGNLLFRPGRLSKQYFAGRRARYIQPVRLYLITSLIFFFSVSLINFIKVPPSLDALKAENQQAQNQQIEIDLDNQLPFLSARQDSRAQRLMQSQLQKAREMAQNDTRELVDRIIEASPAVLFILVPIFALLLKLIYLFANRYYTEHLILAIHNHCFVFVLLTNMMILGLILSRFPYIESVIDNALSIYLPIYLWLSLKSVYQQSLLLTTVKFMLLGICYSLLLGMGMLLAILLGILSL